MLQPALAGLFASVGNVIGIEGTTQGMESTRSDAETEAAFGNCQGENWTVLADEPPLHLFGFELEVRQNSRFHPAVILDANQRRCKAIAALLRASSTSPSSRRDTSR